ncbi:acyl-CoA N-acyltransferase [Chlamydoabsidia padenii]|nr:acyl-CoA N-acyltransferase [Chlamydoabsidia padenii]
MPTYTNPILKPALTEKDKELAMDVRIKVFVDEQQYPLYTEVDDYYNDKSKVWIALCDKVLDDGTIKHQVPVGTIRLITKSETVGTLGRLAVLSDARGMALGKKLVQLVLKHAADQGMNAIVIAAQHDKRGFYEKLGFILEQGDEEGFLEDGTLHLRMWHRGIGNGN